MAILIIAALAGIWKFRFRTYWKWLAIMLLWMISMNFLFNGGGTLQDPSGDGLLTRQIRAAAEDGPAMGLFAIAFIVIYWGFNIFCIRKMYLAAKQINEDQLISEEIDPTTVLRKLGETALLFVISAGWVYLAFFQSAAITSSAAQQGTQLENKAVSNKDPIAEDLAAAADELTATLPQIIDPITRLDRVSTSGRNFTYHYTITRRDASNEALVKFIEKNAIPKACKDANMSNAMRDYNVTYRYSYTLPNQAKPVEVEAKWEKCG